MVLLLFVAGPRHPPTADDSVPLGTPRIVLGWLTLCFVVIGFTPIPIKILQPQQPSKQQQQPQQHQFDPRPAQATRSRCGCRPTKNERSLPFTRPNGSS